MSDLQRKYDDLRERVEALEDWFEFKGNRAAADELLSLLNQHDERVDE